MDEELFFEVSSGPHQGKPLTPQVVDWHGAACYRVARANTAVAVDHVPVRAVPDLRAFLVLTNNRVWVDVPGHRPSLVSPHSLKEAQEQKDSVLKH